MFASTSPTSSTSAASATRRRSVSMLAITVILLSPTVITPIVSMPYGISPFTGYGFNPIASAMYGYGLGVAGGYGGYGGYGKGFGFPFGLINGYGLMPFGLSGMGPGYGLSGLAPGAFGMGGYGGMGAMGGYGMGGYGMGGFGGMGGYGMGGYSKQFGMEADFYKRMAEEERKAASNLVPQTKFAPGSVGQMMANA